MCWLRKSDSSVTAVVKIEMQIKGIFSSALPRDPLKSNLTANFEAFKYENDNRVGAPDCGAEVWDLSRPPIENGKR